MPKINISPLKATAKKLPSEVQELIDAQRQTMDLDDFLANVKVWENKLKRGGKNDV